jgi:hypothetical protein
LIAGKEWVVWTAPRITLKGLEYFVTLTADFGRFLIADGR